MSFEGYYALTMRQQILRLFFALPSNPLEASQEEAYVSVHVRGRSCAATTASSEYWSTGEILLEQARMVQHLERHCAL